MKALLSRFAVVCLAAGASKRMGEPKGLVPWKETTWLDHQLEGLVALSPGQIILVLGFHAERYRAAVAALREPSPLLTLATNHAPERGPFTSLQVGLAAVKGAFAGALILPLDVPVPHPSVWFSLGEAVSRGDSAAVPQWGGRGGHPVALGQKLLARLGTLPPDAPDARLDFQLRRLGEKVARVPVEDPRIHVNLNTPEDLRRYGEGFMP